MAVFDIVVRSLIMSLCVMVDCFRISRELLPCDNALKALKADLCVLKSAQLLCDKMIDLCKESTTPQTRDYLPCLKNAQLRKPANSYPVVTDA